MEFAPTQAMTRRGELHVIDSDLIVFVVTETKLELQAFVAPLRSRGVVRACSNRGVVQHALESLLVSDPRRYAPTPYFTGGDLFASLTSLLIKSE
jgi:hypothetical protein